MLKQTALMLKDVSFQFIQDAPHFFKNLSISFAAQKLHFIRGQNGAGKSTLLRILQGHIDKNEIATGTLSVFDHTTNLARSQTLDCHIGFVPQRFDMMIADQFSFLDNCRLALMSRFPGLSPLAVDIALPQLLTRFSIDLHSPVYLLSGGQRQILAIIMALQKKASLLLLDEPTATLDEDNAQMVMQFLHDMVITQKITILIVCHDRTLLQKYARDYYYELVVNDTSGVRSLIQRAQESLVE